MSDGTTSDTESTREGARPVDARDRPRSTRLFYVSAGAVCLGLGAAGAILPLLPTTPFVLLAAACFARSSPTFHKALRESRLFGEVLRDWEEHRSVSRASKLKASALIVVVFTVTITWALDNTTPRLIMGAAGVALLVFLACLPETPARDREGSR